MQATRVYSEIIGWGMAVPDHVVTNDDLAKIVDTSDEWIRSRTGIAERRIAGPKETASSLATSAATKALEIAGAAPNEVDFILVSTSTPDYVSFPSTASLVQDALGADNAAACDISAACAGFVYALSLANSMIVSGQCKTVLVISTEVMSRIVDWKDRNTCVLFGDGAGAVVLRGSESDAPSGILNVALGSDGSGAEFLKLQSGNNNLPQMMNGVPDRNLCLKMNGKEVYKFAVHIISKSTQDLLRKAGLKSSDVDIFIPHQANTRIIEAAAKAMDVPVDKFFQNIASFGNTSAASIPIALCQAIEQGKLKPHQTVVLVGFGGGLSWGSTVIKWGRARVVPKQTAWHDAQRQLLVRLRLARVRIRRAVRQIKTLVSV